MLFRIIHSNKGFISLNRFPDGGDGSGGNDGDGAAGGDKGGAGAAVADWREGLDPSIREHPSLKDLKTPQDVAKSYVNVQHLIGKEKIPIPGKDTDPMDDIKGKDWNIVYDRLGRPSDPKAYEIPKVKSPEGFPAVAPERIDQFKTLAHKIGLLPHQVKALYAWQHGEAINMHQQGTQAREQSMQQSETALRKEYGKAYDANISGAKGVITKFGGKEVFAALESSGLGNDPHMIKFFVNLSKQFGEDGKVFNGEAQRGSILSPDEAKVEIDKIKSDRQGAYWNDGKKFTDAEHKAMVRKVADLYEMAHPSK
jgi:hypothetical protein